MKNLMMPLLCVLLTSCYSYKKMDVQLGELVKDESYKIHQIGKAPQKGTFHSMNDSLLILNNRRGKLHEISLKEIERINKRKFSLGKTIALPFGVFIGASGIVMATNGGPGSINY